MDRDNLRLFLNEVGPVARELGIFLAIHPDDPPRRLFGLPRIVSTDDDIRKITGSYDVGPDTSLERLRESASVYQFVQASLN